MKLESAFSRDKSMAGELYKVFGRDRRISLCDGVVVEFEGVPFGKSTISVPEIAAFVITVGAHVPAALAAEYIKDWIKGQFGGRSETIALDEEEITFYENGHPKQVIKRAIKMERK